MLHGSSSTRNLKTTAASKALLKPTETAPCRTRIDVRRSSFGEPPPRWSIRSKRRARRLACGRGLRCCLPFSNGVFTLSPETSSTLSQHTRTLIVFSPSILSSGSQLVCVAQQIQPEYGVSKCVHCMSSYLSEYIPPRRMMYIP